MPQRVLWIENEAPVRAMVRRLLEEGGLSVEESATGLDALARARALPPDLVLGDTQLPDIGGLELAARLKNDVVLGQVPFVALGRGPGEQEVALAAGCDAYIAQPIDPARLADQVKAVLAGRSDGLEAQRRARNVVRQRSAFMKDLAHELSTPLTPLTGYLKILLSERLGPLSPQQLKVMQGMASAVARLSRIVDNLSDFADLEAGSAAITVAPLEPDRLADEVVEEFREAFREARLHVEVRPSGSGPVLGDRRKLRQALANLVHNAVKFSPHGGEVLVEVTRDPLRLRFAVYDQGPGIAIARQATLFEPFQAGPPTDARPPGSGLGLPVARRIAEAHGGRVVVESPPHTQPTVGSHHYTGAKFVIEIPAHPPGDVPARPVPASSA